MSELGLLVTLRIEPGGEGVQFMKPFGQDTGGGGVGSGVGELLEQPGPLFVEQGKGGFAFLVGWRRCAAFRVSSFRRLIFCVCSFVGRRRCVGSRSSVFLPRLRCPDGIAWLAVSVPIVFLRRLW
jgi:hypothetical protein